MWLIYIHIPTYDWWPEFNPCDPLEGRPDSHEWSCDWYARAMSQNAHFFLSYRRSMYVCVCVCVCVCARTHTCSWKSAVTLHLISWGKVPHWTQSILTAGLVDEWVCRSTYLYHPLPQHWGSRQARSCVATIDPNSGPQAGSADTLPAEPFPNLQHHCGGPCKRYSQHAEKWCTWDQEEIQFNVAKARSNF